MNRIRTRRARRALAALAVVAIGLLATGAGGSVAAESRIGLLGAVPRAGAAHNGRLQEIPGRVPSLAELPRHCAFADRCPRADEQSWSDVPELRQVRPDHVVACFHPGER